ncbi:MAG: asparaginase [Chromatiales bacterium]
MLWTSMPVSSALTAETPLPAHAPLAVATRGGHVESVHYGSIAVVDRAGKLLWGCGDPHVVIFTRSSLKPLQAIPLIAHPEVGRYDFTRREIALICASHSGEPRHAEAIVGILKKIGCEKRDLQCGVHPPLYFEAMGISPHAEDIFTTVHHNCSGKHAGMLALCRLLGAPLETYLNPSHPVQQAILAAVAHFSGTTAESIPLGVDGCSAPIFALPLAALARAYARLGEEGGNHRYGDAPQRILQAMTTHPEMVSGIKRIDLALAHVGRGDWLAKSGAEGVHALTIRSRGIGIAMKVADGAARAAHAVIVETLRQIGLVDDVTNTSLAAYARPQLTNWRNMVTGEVLPIFQLRAVD